MRVAVFLADGFEECEALIVVDILRRAGIETIIASVTKKIEVVSSRHIIVKSDCLAEEIEYDTVDMIVLPGGRRGTAILSDSSLVKEKCAEFAENKYIAAICAAPSILAGMGLVKKAAVHPDFIDKMGDTEVIDQSVVIDRNIITGQGLGAAFEFSFKLVDILVGNEKSDGIKKAICFNYAF